MNDSPIHGSTDNLLDPNSVEIGSAKWIDKENTMASLDNKELVRTFLETAFCEKDLEAAANMISEDYCLHDLLRPNYSGDRSTFKEAHKAYIEGVRNHSFTIKDQVSEGDKVVTRWTVSGCQKKGLPGILFKGAYFKIGGITMTRVADGKVIEEWQDWDALGLARQIGIARHRRQPRRKRRLRVST